MAKTSRSLAGASVIALATVCMATSALAQVVDNKAAPDTTATNNTAPSTDDTVVVVTGLRNSLATAQAVKQKSDQIVDSITAQDIGKFPDVDIAESLQRIPGIQIQRNLGDGSTVAIRGLNQVRTELNGHDIFSANGGVGLSYDEVGPDLLARLDVYKNPSSDMIEGSLAGTINLVTRKPFDAKGEVMSATASVTNYDLAKKTGENVSALYSNRWSTSIGEVGFLANASYQTTAFRQDLDQVEPYQYWGPCNTNGTPVHATPDGSAVQCTPVQGHETENVLVPKGGGFNVQNGTRVRSSQNFSFQWRPNENFEAYAELFNSTYNFQTLGNSYFVSDGGAKPTGTFKVEDGVAVAGSLANPGLFSGVFGTNRKTSTTEFTTGFKWHVTPHLRLAADYEHLDSEVNQKGANEYLFSNSTRASYNYVFDNTGKFPVQGTDTPGYLANPANYNYGAVQPTATRNTATADAIKLDLTWDFDNGFFRQVSGGVRYSRKNAINRDASSWNGFSSTSESVAANPAFVQVNPKQQTILRGDGTSSVFGPVLGWLQSDSKNPQDAFAHYKTLTGNTIDFPDFNDPLHKSFSPIKEDDTAVYLKTTFGSELAGFNFDGNAGVRYVETEETGEGYKTLTYGTTTQTKVETPYSGGNKYNFLLPSFNLRVHLTDKLQARFAFSKNIYRPDFSQLNPTYTINPNYTGNNTTPDTVNPGQPYNATTNPYQGSVNRPGNPDLKPERVTSYDASLEWYFAKDGSLTIDFYHKDIADLIDSRPYSITETVPTVGVVRFDGTAVTNVTSGYVKGFEISGQKFFDFLPGAWSGLGVAANYTLADSDAGTVASQTIGGAAFAVPLVNLSKNSYNFMVLYDKYGWNARVAYNWRSDYLDSVNETGAVSLPIYFKAYGSLDASVSYDLNEHVSFTIDGQNLTDTVQKSYQGREILLRNYQINDRRISARIRLKY
ncbi:TonB-dependent receptor [Asticcacaulis sp. 201]|uniref:TonB-dependent receptor n=1 Tax=Asticcacaulis sp. 201 TaxID=3028787 RepID=UPI002916E574|nr:TonB-dependent receptor [Asticcacaulis sp. 201]MDV6331132.1 TonB-dependent receptor [Asticcacaulis sp. 201]